MSSKLLETPRALLNVTRRIAIEAGAIALSHFDDTGYVGAEHKEDGSPVTVADRETEEFIERALHETLPTIPVIGEEAASSGTLPDAADGDFWLVDPIDGTKEFVAGSPDFTVNIALIRNGIPIIGVVYAPALGELYAGLNTENDKLAVRWLEETDKEKEIRVRRPEAAGLHVITGRRHKIGPKLESFLTDFKVAKLTQRGSSIKLCMIACGKADLYPQFGQTCQWDTAAGHAVLSAAGGCLTHLDGKSLGYGLSDVTFCNLEFVAAGFEWFEAS